MSNNKSDFYESSMRVRRTLEIGSNVTQIGAGATTGVIFAVIGHSFVREFLSPTLSFLFAAIVMFIGVGVFELCTRRTLPFGLDEFLGRKWKHETVSLKKKYRKYFMLAMLFLSFGLMAGSMSTSWFARVDMAEAAVEAPTRADLEGMSKDMISMQKKDREWYDKEINRLQETEDERIKAVEDDNKQKMNAAIMSKGAKMAKEYRGGNGWAANQLRSAINMAKESSASALDRERRKIDDMIKRRDAALNSGSSPTLLAINQVASQEAEKQQEYRAKKARNQWLIGAFGVACTILFFLFQLGLSFIRIMCDESTVATSESRGIIGGIMDQIEKGKAMARQGRSGNLVANESIRSVPRVAVKEVIPFEIPTTTDTVKTPQKAVKISQKKVKTPRKAVVSTSNKNKRMAVKQYVSEYIQNGNGIPTGRHIATRFEITEKTARKYLKENSGIVAGKFIGDEQNKTISF